MPRLRPLPLDKVISILEEDGCQHVRTTKTSLVMAKIEMDGGEPVSVGTVYVPNRSDVLVAELRQIIKRSGIHRAKFE